MEKGLAETMGERIRSLPNKQTRSDQTSDFYNEKQRPFSRVFESFKPELQVNSKTRDQVVYTELPHILPRVNKSVQIKRGSYNDVRKKRILKSTALREAVKEIQELSFSNKKIQYRIQRTRKDVERSGYLSALKEMKTDVRVKQRKKEFQKLQPIPDLDYVRHNKETLLNLTSECERPVGDIQWVKKMQGSPKLQRISLDLGEKWKKKRSKRITVNNLDFTEIEKELLISPAYGYCRTCSDSKEILNLKRSRCKSTKPYNQYSYQD